MKTPAIKITEEQYYPIAKKLLAIGYQEKSIKSFEKFPYLILNFGNLIGNIGNSNISCINGTRYLVPDEESFLILAESLFHLKQKDLKPGMLIKVKDSSEKYLVMEFNNELFLYNDFHYLIKLYKDNNNKLLQNSDIEQVFMPYSAADAFKKNNNAVLIWEKKEYIKMTKQAIEEELLLRPGSLIII